MNTPASILVAHTTVGSGHRMAAEAVADALRSSGGDQVALEVLDALTCGPGWVTAERLASSFTGPTSGLYDAAWRSASVGAMARRIGTPALTAMYRRFTRKLLSSRPSVIVCTHALPAVLAARLVRSGRLTSQVVTVATDFRVHGFWPLQGIARLCVADPASREDLIARGAAADQVTATGIPLRAQFAHRYDRDRMRERLGIPEGNRLVLAVAGASVSLPYRTLQHGLLTSLPTIAALPRTSLIVISGNDAEFAAELASRTEAYRANQVHVMGRVDQMASLMAAADLVVAKPGGLICAESLSCGTPLVLVGPAVGQERANMTRLVSEGAALPCDDVVRLDATMRAALEPARSHRMRDAALALGRPRSAFDVATLALELAGVPLSL